MASTGARRRDGLFHVGAIAALFYFTWSAFFVAVFLWWVSEASASA